MAKVSTLIISLVKLKKMTERRIDKIVFMLYKITILTMNFQIFNYA